jgi:hypothetical protein
MPAKQRASMLRLLAIGAFSVGTLGIVARTHQPAATIHLSSLMGEM